MGIFAGDLGMVTRRIGNSVVICGEAGAIPDIVQNYKLLILPTADSPALILDSYLYVC